MGCWCRRHLRGSNERKSDVNLFTCEKEGSLRNKICYTHEVSWLKNHSFELFFFHELHPIKRNRLMFSLRTQVLLVKQYMKVHLLQIINLLQILQKERNITYWQAVLKSVDAERNFSLWRKQSDKFRLYFTPSTIYSIQW